VAGANELLDLSVILVVVSLAVEEAARVIKDRPVVFTTSSDPLEAGLAQSLSHPGGTFTGTTLASPVAAGKRVELIHQAVPRLRTLAVLRNLDRAGERAERRATEASARRLGINLVDVPFSHGGRAGVPDLHAALEAVRRAQPDAMMVHPDATTLAHGVVVATFARAHRLPSMFGWMDYLGTGALMSYGPDLRNAQLLGLTLPQSLSLQADLIIDTTRPQEPIRGGPLAL